MSPPGTAAVIGLGLIGGSLARDLHALGATVLAWDPDPVTLRGAAAEGVVREMSGSLEELAAADVVVLAAPIPAIREMMPRIAARSGDAVVTDVGSVKGPVHEAAKAAGLGERFVGSHPLAGDVTSGWAASRAGLFRGGRVFVSPGSPRLAADAPVRAVVELWRAVGGIPEIIDPDEHDVMIAWVSHAPQVVSSALGVALARAGVAPASLGPGGRSVTRLAASSPELWSGILQANAAHAAAAARAVAATLLEIASAIERHDGAVISSALSEARRWAQRPG